MVDGAGHASDSVEVILRGVNKVYGEGELAVNALVSVDLQVAIGELVVVLGPSGSEKTTLLNMIGGNRAGDERLGRRRRMGSPHAR